MRRSTSKQQRQDLQKSASLKSNENTGEDFQNQLSEFWKSTKGLQEERLFGEQVESQLEQQALDLWCFNLPYFYPPLPSSTVALKTNSLVTMVAKRTNSLTAAKRGRMDFQLP